MNEYYIETNYALTNYDKQLYKEVFLSFNKKATYQTLNWNSKFK